MTPPTEKFRVVAEHLTLLSHAEVKYLEHEVGGPAVDPKRPYGTSNVLRDIARILNIEPDDPITSSGFSEGLEARLLALHRQTAIALQVFLHTGKMELGLYERERYGRWTGIGAELTQDKMC